MEGYQIYYVNSNLKFFTKFDKGLGFVPNPFELGYLSGEFAKSNFNQRRASRVE